jgi:DNA-binding NarL/FixJ family response regulator
VAAPIVAALRKHQAGPQETARHRSQTILRGIKQGTSNQALAESLNISLSTLKSHLRRLFAEYGVTNRHGLLLAYPDEGLSPVPL